MYHTAMWRCSSSFSMVGHLIPTNEHSLDSLDISLFFFYLRFSFPPSPFFSFSKPQVLCVGSFSSISFTFNDMIIHISRLFQIITAFQSLFTLTSLPQMFFYVLHAPFFFFSLKIFIFLMAIVENAFPQKQCIIICHRDRGKEKIEQFSKRCRAEGWIGH